MGICRIRTRTVAGLFAATLIIPIGLAEPPAHAEAGGCSPGMLSDFNGDGFSDAVVADLGCDGFTDLVVGTPREDVSGHADSGLVQIIWGDAGGLGAGEPSEDITQDRFRFWGFDITAGDQFGYAVDALENVEQGGTGDEGYAVAMGVPGGNIDGRDNAGWVAMLHAWDGGITINTISQSSVGVPGSAETGDRFGAAVSIGYLLETRQDDELWIEVAVGVPGEDVGRDSNAGAVQLFNSNTRTLTPGASLTQDTAGVSGASEPGDLFGSQLAFAAPSLGDRATRLAVSVPGEDAAKVNQGIVQVFPVTDLDAESTYAQDSPGVPGAVEAGDEFGETLAFVNGVSERALIVGVPDDVGNRAGMVDVIPLGGGARRAWVPGSGGVPLAGASRFGGAVASVHGGTA